MSNTPIQASPDWNLVEVRLRAHYLDGSPAKGSVTAKANLRRFLDEDTVAPFLVVANDITAKFNNVGLAVLYLPATDDPDITPRNFTYAITESIVGVPPNTYEIEVPISMQESGIELARVQTIAPSNGEVFWTKGLVLHGDGPPGTLIGGLSDFYIDDDALVLYGPKTIETGWGEPHPMVDSADFTGAELVEARDTARQYRDEAEILRDEVPVMVPPLVIEALAEDSAPAAAAEAAVASALADAGVLHASRLVGFGENLFPDPQGKVYGNPVSNSVYTTVRRVEGVPGGFKYGLELTRTDAASHSVLGSTYFGVVGGSPAGRALVTPGVPYYGMVHGWTDQAGMSEQASIQFLDGAGAVIGVATSGPLVALPAGTLKPCRVGPVVAPEGAVHAIVQGAVMVTLGTAAPVGGKSLFTGAMISSKAIVEYGDGTRPGWIWTDGEHESVSKKVFSSRSDGLDLVSWAISEAFVISGSVVRNTDGVVTSCNVVWPDGSAGVFTATDTAGGMLNAYTVTHVASGLKVTQPAVTRNTAGEVTSVPTPTVGEI